MLLTSSSCEIIEIRTAVSAAKDSSKKEGAEIKGDISGSKNPSAGAAKSAKRRKEEKNTIDSDKGSKRYNLGNTLNLETNQQERKFRSTPINLFDDECAFCHSFRATEVGYFQFLLFSCNFVSCFLGQGQF